MKIIKFFLILFLFSLTFKASAQDAVFSQYYSSGLYLNPAMAGVEPYLTFSSNHRTQWGSITTPYVTSQASLIAPIYAKGVDATHRGGIGFSFYNDRAGALNFNTTGANVNAAYNLHLSSLQMLSFGVQGGFIQKSINGNQQWGQQYDPILGYNATGIYDETQLVNKVTMPDISSGVMYYFNSSKNYTEKGFSGYAGLSMYHMNMPNESLVKGLVSKLPALYKANVGFEVRASQKVNLAPSAIFVLQNNVKQINAGMYLTYNLGMAQKEYSPTYLILGAWYRLQDSFIFSTGFGNDFYTIGLSYDLNNSTLRYTTQGKGAYEISLTVHRVKANKAKRYYTPRI